MDQQEYNKMISDLKVLVANGDVESMRYLGDLYYQGTSGSDENTFAALPYWKMAADHGENDLAFKVGLCFITGTGCEEDDVQGYKYLKQGADAGIAEAQYRVGLCLLEGIGTSVNHIAGEEYLRAAACNNHPQAQLGLSKLFFNDENRFEEAMHWTCCAHLNGIEDATEILNIVGSTSHNAALIRERLEYIKIHGVVPPSNMGIPQSSDGGWVVVGLAEYFV